MCVNVLCVVCVVWFVCSSLWIACAVLLMFCVLHVCVWFVFFLLDCMCVCVNVFVDCMCLCLLMFCVLSVRVG